MGLPQKIRRKCPTKEYYTTKYLFTYSYNNGRGPITTAIRKRNSHVANNGLIESALKTKNMFDKGWLRTAFAK